MLGAGGHQRSPAMSHPCVTPAEAVSVLPPTGAAAEALLCFGESPQEATARLVGAQLAPCTLGF